jgi:hypothetical protein
VESRGALESGLLWIAGVCAAGALVALLAGAAGLAIGVSDGKYDALLSRRTLFAGTAAGLLLTAALLFVARRLRRPGLAFGASVLSIAVVVPLAHAASAYADEARSSRLMSRYLSMHFEPHDMVVCYEQYRPGLNFYLGRRIFLVTTGTPFSSWYVMEHLEEMRRDPQFPIISMEHLRALLAAPSPEVFIVAPRRMYDRMRADVGDVLRPDPIYEDLGAGLFVRSMDRRGTIARAGPRRAPGAPLLGDGPRDVVSSPSHQSTGPLTPG